MNKKISKVLALFLAVIMSLPLASFASLGIFAEDVDVPAVEKPTYTEPTVTGTTVAYFSYSGNDSNNGLSASAMKKTITPAWTLLHDEGGTLVIPVKGYVSGDLTLTPRLGPVLITARDTDGTLYFDPANPDIDVAQAGMFMIAALKTVTFTSDVIFDDIVILQRGCTSVANVAAIKISSGATMVIGENTQFHFCTAAAGNNKAVANSKFVVDEGATLVVKAAGASSYEGAGTIFVDKDLIGNGIDASQFVKFTGKLYDLDGAPVCDIAGHNYVTTLSNHTYYDVCSTCGETVPYTYTTPTLNNTTDAVYWANGSDGDGTSVNSPAQGGGTIAGKLTTGGTVYIVGKGYVGATASLNYGGVTKFTSVTPDGNDYRGVDYTGVEHPEDGALFAPADAVITFADSLIFEKTRVLSRNSSSPIYKFTNGSTIYFDETEFARTGATFKYPALIIEKGTTVIINEKCTGGISSVSGDGTLIVSMKAVQSGLVTATALDNFNGLVMTTECKEICAFTGSHSYIGNVCEICGTEQGTATTKIYVAKNATGDGLSPENPTNSLRRGFEYASADPIEIILVDDMLISGGIACQGQTQDVTITSMDIDGDGVYPKLIIQSFITFYSEGDGNTITFKNIEIQSDRSGTVPFFMNYNNLVIGEGVKCTLSGNYEDGYYPTIYAGFLESQSAPADSAANRSSNSDCTIDIASGTWRMVVGGNRRNAATYAIGNYAGNLTMNVTGGTFIGNESNGIAIAGTGENFYSGNIDIKISSGDIRGDIVGVYSVGQYNGDTAYGDYGFKGDISIDITGGYLSGDIYAQDYNIKIPALIRGNVAVTLGIYVEFVDVVTVDLRGTVAYAGQSKVSSLEYDEILSEYVVTKFIDVINGTETGDGEPVRIAFIGDSITQGTGSSDFALYSYPAQLQAMLDYDEYMIGNFGVGASGVLPSTRYFYNDTLQYHLIMEEFDPSIVSFALGTNDGLSAGGTNGVAQSFENLYYDLIKEAGDIYSVSKIYVATPILRLDSPSRQSRNASIIEPAIRRIVAKLTQQGYDATVFELNANTYEEVLAGNVLGTDNLHPNEDGYAIMAQAFYDAIFNDVVDVPEGYYVDTFYVSDNGTETGAGTAEDPSTHYEVGLARLNKAGGTLIVLDSYTIGADVVTPTDITGKIIIKGETPDAVLNWGGNTFKLGSDAEIDDIKFITTSATPYIIAWYNDVTIGENFTNETQGTKDLGFAAGYFVYATESMEGVIETTTYDTFESASSANDVNITIKNGTFGIIFLGNKRMDPKAPVGNYSGNMTVNLLGGTITGNCESTAVSGVLTMMNLSGNITVNFDGMAVDAPFYVVSRTATLSNVVYDSSLNTGSIVINAPASIIDTKFVDNERPNVDDKQHASIENVSINSTTAAGDIDEDDSFTNADITLIIRYLAGWDVAGASISADVTADDKINNRDALALVLKVAGWDE